MTDWSKAIQTLQALPSNNPTYAELKAKLEKMPAWARQVARNEVEYQLLVQGSELSAWGYMNESLKCAERLIEAGRILERHGYILVEQDRG